MKQHMRMMTAARIGLMALSGWLCLGAAHAATVEERYNGACINCHGTGAAGAPKKGDAAAWAPRLKQGNAVLLAHIKNGFKAMPPRGLCNDCTDDEYRSLIVYMSQ